MKVYFYGCWSRQELGHYLHDPAGRRCWDDLRALPWAIDELDGGLCPDAGARPDSVMDRGGAQVEGSALLHHRRGWTALAFWDRSADERFNSNAAFIAEGTHSSEQMLSLARQFYPRVMERFYFQIVLAVGGGGAGGATR